MREIERGVCGGGSRLDITHVKQEWRAGRFRQGSLCGERGWWIGRSLGSEEIGWFVKMGQKKKEVTQRTQRRERKEKPAP